MYIVSVCVDCYLWCVCVDVTVYIVCVCVDVTATCVYCEWLCRLLPVVCLCRRDCYRCITETLDYLLSTGQQFPQAPSVPRLPGPPPVHDPGRLSGAEAEKYVITSQHCT